MNNPGTIPHPERFLDAWLRESTEPVVLTDASGKVLDKSAAAPDGETRRVEVRIGEKLVGYLLIGKKPSGPAPRIDPLTGLLNRPTVEELFDLWSHSLSGEECLAVVFLDLDQFKQVNDHYGHPAGDRALRAFADTLDGYLRTHAERYAAARYGGDEFVILLPPQAKSAEELLALLAENLNRAENFPNNNVLEERTRFSFGIAYAHSGEAFSEVLLRADQALYTMKRAR